ncbi:MAG: hypothetical protein QW568_00735 [Candidatus Anstonellaceae archaeon]
MSVAVRNIFKNHSISPKDISRDIKDGLKLVKGKGTFLQGVNLIFGALRNASQKNRHHVRPQVSGSWEGNRKCTIGIYCENSFPLASVTISKHSPAKIRAFFGGKKVTVEQLAQKIMGYAGVPQLMQ